MTKKKSKKGKTPSYILNGVEGITNKLDHIENRSSRFEDKVYNLILGVVVYWGLNPGALNH